MIDTQLKRIVVKRITVVHENKKGKEKIIGIA